MFIKEKKKLGQHVIFVNALGNAIIIIKTSHDLVSCPEHVEG